MKNKHNYKTGTDLLGTYFVSFKVTISGLKFGHFETFENQSDKFQALRKLVLIKQELYSAMRNLSRAKYKLAQINSQLRSV